MRPKSETAKALGFKRPLLTSKPPDQLVSV
jgi:hypothetical protein